MESASHAASPRTVLLTPDPSILSGARPQRRALAAIAVVLIVLGLASFWFWIFLEYTPLWYALIVGSEHVEPMLGTSAQELQWIFCGVSIALAAVVASASELVVGLRSWAWPYQRVCRLGPIEFTWVGVSIWLLVIGSIASWALQRLIPDIKEDLDPAQAHFAAPWACVLDDLAFYAGKVSMIPISLLGVPLARSSAMWRLAGLSYEEAITYHRWLGASAVVLTTLHTLGYVIYYLQHTGDHIAPPCEPAQPAFRVTLDSNGKRPAMADCHKVFACYNKFLAAAGGPETLLEHLDASLPTQVRLLRLTHPM